MKPAVNSKNALPVIIVASRKWASLPLPVPWGDSQVQSLYSAVQTDWVQTPATSEGLKDTKQV